MSDPGRLFPLDDIPEVPLLREPRRSRGENDARFRNDYPPDWDRCTYCEGRGAILKTPDGRDAVGIYSDEQRRTVMDRDLASPLVERGWTIIDCPACFGMGSLKACVRRKAGHRCERCFHPYIPKGDAKMLGIAPSSFPWSACDPVCRHRGPMRVMTTEGWADFDPTPEACGPAVYAAGQAEAEWRILTVHHLDGDKANCRWWNLAALCQRCHLEIQAKVVMERIYPHEHTAWFKPHAAGYYAFVYLNEELSRPETVARMDELLALEYDPQLSRGET